MPTKPPPQGNPQPDAERARDEIFIRLLRAYRRSGGIVRWTETTESTQQSGRLQSHSPSPHVICFEWGGDLWLPRFQFDECRMVVAGTAQVIAELESVFDAWEMACWFCEPNLWIGGARPVDLVASCQPSVLGAARADRFIASG